MFSSCVRDSCLVVGRIPRWPPRFPLLWCSTFCIIPSTRVDGTCDWDDAVMPMITFWCWRLLQKSGRLTCWLWTRSYHVVSGLPSEALRPISSCLRVSRGQHLGRNRDLSLTTSGDWILSTIWMSSEEDLELQKRTTAWPISWPQPATGNRESRFVMSGIPTYRNSETTNECWFKLKFVGICYTA